MHACCNIYSLNYVCAPVEDFALYNKFEAFVEDTGVIVGREELNNKKVTFAIILQ